MWCDTGFFKKWFDKDEPKFFNCWDEDIKLETIESELVKKNGRRVFRTGIQFINIKPDDKNRLAAYIKKTTEKA